MTTLFCIYGDPELDKTFRAEPGSDVSFIGAHQWSHFGADGIDRGRYVIGNDVRVPEGPLFGPLFIGISGNQEHEKRARNVRTEVEAGTLTP